MREHFYTGANGPQDTIQFATTPRYLAGGGDPRRVTEVLQAAGWTNHSDPAYPHVLLASPDTAVHLTLEPTAPDTSTAWWKFRARGWYAAFGGHTPVEILAGFSDALLHPAPDPPPTPAGIHEILTSTGWARENDEKGTASALSPDASVRMGPRPGLDDAAGRPTWSAEAAPATGFGDRRLWSAWFSAGTPTHLVAGFAAQLVSPEPVFRGSHSLPNAWMITQKPTTVQGEHLADDHRQRLKAVRAAARKQRKTAAALATRVPATPAAASTRR
ncbi:DUF317 domain-containing protein [Streptomyces sp. CA-111067]|uniref:DUF317 domain-containing protein n=1 Tax=Streptomyces sp. CA-111067 TaxID=3240046 RepID=UPI003D9824EE